eukprot:587730-Ditylum_brightwellii.AAC.1
MVGFRRVGFLSLYLTTSSAYAPIGSTIAATTAGSLSQRYQAHLFKDRHHSNQLISSMSSKADESNIGLGDVNPQQQSQQKNDSSESDIKTWRERIAVSIAKSRKVRGGNYVQIATVDPATNEPRCRT